MSNKLNLILHCGSKKVEREQLAQVVTPDATESWQPVPHNDFVDGVRETLLRSGLSIVQEVHGLSEDGNRYFGMLQINGGENDSDYGFIAGLRNSHDKTFSAGLAAGSGVFVCDNLAFSGEVRLARKHTVHIRQDLPRLITSAVAKLTDYQQQQVLRYDQYRQTELADAETNDILIRAVDVGALPVTKIPAVLREWRNPSHPEFVQAGKTGWRLFNAFTESYKGVESGTLLQRSIALHGLMDVACKVAKPETAVLAG